MTLELIEFIFNPNIYTNCGESGFAAKNNLLHYIASQPFDQNNFYIFHDYLVKYPNEVDRLNSLNFTPLMICLVNKDPETIYYIDDLLSYGANINQKINIYKTVLHSKSNDLDILTFAIINKCGIDIIKCLINFGFNNSNLKNNHPLLLASEYSSKEVIKYIFEKFGDINIRDRLGCTPLYNYCRRRDTDDSETIKFLLDNGADPKIKNKYSQSPLNAAIKVGKNETVKELLIYIFKKYINENDVEDFF